MFYTALKTEQQKNGKWKLLEDLVYDDAVHGLIGIPEGFVTDFASVPRVPIVFDIFGGIGQAGATVHDWLYYTGTLSRTECDKVFLRALRDCGVDRFRSYLMYSAVRIFGFIAFKKARK